MRERERERERNRESESIATDSNEIYFAQQSRREMVKAVLFVSNGRSLKADDANLVNCGVLI